MQRMQLEFADRVAVLKFDHPEVMNAVGGQMLRDFGAAIEEIKSKGTDVRCLLLSGNGLTSIVELPEETVLFTLDDIRFPKKSLLFEGT